MAAAIGYSFTIRNLKGHIGMECRIRYIFLKFKIMRSFIKTETANKKKVQSPSLQRLTYMNKKIEIAN